jgi:hypothetical protein
VAIDRKSEHSRGGQRVRRHDPAGLLDDRDADGGQARRTSRQRSAVIAPSRSRNRGRPLPEARAGRPNHIRRTFSIPTRQCAPAAARGWAVERTAFTRSDPRLLSQHREEIGSVPDSDRDDVEAAVAEARAAAWAQRFPGGRAPCLPRPVAGASGSGRSSTTRFITMVDVSRCTPGRAASFSSRSVAYAARSAVATRNR